MPKEASACLIIKQKIMQSRNKIAQLLNTNDLVHARQQERI